MCRIYMASRGQPLLIATLIQYLSPLCEALRGELETDARVDGSYECRVKGPEGMHVWFPVSSCSIQCATHVEWGGRTALIQDKHFSMVFDTAVSTTNPHFCICFAGENPMMRLRMVGPLKTQCAKNGKEAKFECWTAYQRAYATTLVMAGSTVSVRVDYAKVRESLFLIDSCKTCPMRECPSGFKLPFLINSVPKEVMEYLHVKHDPIAENFVKSLAFDGLNATRGMGTMSKSTTITTTTTTSTTTNGAGAATITTTTATTITTTTIKTTTTTTATTITTTDITSTTTTTTTTTNTNTTTTTITTTTTTTTTTVTTSSSSSTNPTTVVGDEHLPSRKPASTTNADLPSSAALQKSRKSGAMIPANESRGLGQAGAVVPGDEVQLFSPNAPSRRRAPVAPDRLLPSHRSRSSGATETAVGAGQNEFSHRGNLLSPRNEGFGEESSIPKLAPHILDITAANVGATQSSPNSGGVEPALPHQGPNEIDDVHSNGMESLRKLDSEVTPDLVAPPKDRKGYEETSPGTGVIKTAFSQPGNERPSSFTPVSPRNADVVSSLGSGHQPVVVLGDKEQLPSANSGSPRSAFGAIAPASALHSQRSPNSDAIETALDASRDKFSRRGNSVSPKNISLAPIPDSFGIAPANKHLGDEQSPTPKAASHNLDTRVVNISPTHSLPNSGGVELALLHDGPHGIDDGLWNGTVAPRSIDLEVTPALVDPGNDRKRYGGRSADSGFIGREWVVGDNAQVSSLTPVSPGSGRQPVAVLGDREQLSSPNAASTIVGPREIAPASALRSHRSHNSGVIDSAVDAGRIPLSHIENSGSPRNNGAPPWHRYGLIEPLIKFLGDEQSPTRNQTSHSLDTTLTKVSPIQSSPNTGDVQPALLHEGLNGMNGGLTGRIEGSSSLTPISERNADVESSRGLNHQPAVVLGDKEQLPSSNAASPATVRRAPGSTLPSDRSPTSGAIKTAVEAGRNELSHSRPLLSPSNEGLEPVPGLVGFERPVKLVGDRPPNRSHILDSTLANVSPEQSFHGGAESAGPQQGSSGIDDGLWDGTGALRPQDLFETETINVVVNIFP